MLAAVGLEANMNTDQLEKQLPQLQVIVIKHQTLDMEFLAIWLALYSRYKSHTL